MGHAKCKGYEKFEISQQYLVVSQKWLKIDGFMVRGVLQTLNPFFDPCDIYCDCPRGVLRGNQNMVKTAIFGIRGWITEKRLKVEGYMLRGVLQASNPFSIHATFTEIVSGAYPVETKMC